MTVRSSGLRGFTLIELLVVVGIIALLISLLLPAVQQAREAARRTQCRNQLRQLALGLHLYHGTAQMLPAGSYVRGPAFPVESGWGWGAMILPHVEQSNLYDRIDFHVGTAVFPNDGLLTTELPLWRCPSDPAPSTLDISVPGEPDVRVSAGNYAGVSSMLFGMSRVRFRDVTDGLSHTLLLGERTIIPAAPGSRRFTSAWFGSIATRTQGVFDAVPFLAAFSARPINAAIGAADSFSSRHAGGVFFALGDGSVQFFNEHIDAEIYDALGTRDGGEIVEF